MVNQPATFSPEALFSPLELALMNAKTNAEYIAAYAALQAAASPPERELEALQRKDRLSADELSRLHQLSRAIRCPIGARPKSWTTSVSLIATYGASLRRGPSRELEACRPPITDGRANARST